MLEFMQLGENLGQKNKIFLVHVLICGIVETHSLTYRKYHG